MSDYNTGSPHSLVVRNAAKPARRRWLKKSDAGLFWSLLNSIFHLVKHWVLLIICCLGSSWFASCKLLKILKRGRMDNMIQTRRTCLKASMCTHHVLSKSPQGLLPFPRSTGLLVSHFLNRGQLCAALPKVPCHKEPEGCMGIVIRQWCIFFAGFYLAMSIPLKSDLAEHETLAPGG